MAVDRQMAFEDSQPVAQELGAVRLDPHAREDGGVDMPSPVRFLEQDVLVLQRGIKLLVEVYLQEFRRPQTLYLGESEDVGAFAVVHLQQRVAQVNVLEPASRGVFSEPGVI